MKRRYLLLAACLAAAVLLLTALAGCGGKKEDTSGTKTETTTTGESTEKKADEGKVYGIGEMATLKSKGLEGVEFYQEGSEIGVTKVTVTNDIASPEANALLLLEGVDYPGENPPKSPASGNEFLMITMEYKNNASTADAFPGPASLKLTNAKGVEYETVETHGHRGIYNAYPIDPGAQSTATAVFEVPAGETGLVLTCEPYGAVPVKFKIR